MNRGDTLSLSPPAAAVELAEAGHLTNSASCDEGFRIRDQTDNLEVQVKVSRGATGPSSRCITFAISGRTMRLVARRERTIFLSALGALRIP